MNRLTSYLNRFSFDMNRFNPSSRQLESFQLSLDLHQSSLYLLCLGLCFSVSESIHILIELIQSVGFVRKLSLLTHYYIYTSLITPKFIESFTSILSRSQKLIAHTSFKIKHFFFNHFVFECIDSLGC